MALPRLFAMVLMLATVALTVAACESDDGTSPPEPPPSDEQKVANVGNDWAPLFAKDAHTTCRFMTQPACEQIHCRGNEGPIRNCTPPPSEFRKSFRDAKVKRVVIAGNEAGAEFSNGEAIQLEHVSGYELGGIWLIHKFGDRAGKRFFGP